MDGKNLCKSRETPCVFEDNRSDTDFLLILKNGQRLKVDELSVTRAKHMRRCGSEMGFTREDGKKMNIKGNDIKKVLPLA